MRYFKKISLGLLFLMHVSVGLAAPSYIKVEQADVVVDASDYIVNADFDIQFDAALAEAIQKGVSLPFVLEFQIVEFNKYWFDDEIVTVSKDVDISYHALTEQYLVNDGSSQKSFDTLQEAIAEISELRDWHIKKRVNFESDERYVAAILMRINTNKLPKIIQVDSIGSEDWSLSSQIHKWDIKPVK